MSKNFEITRDILLESQESVQNIFNIHDNIKKFKLNEFIKKTVECSKLSNELNGLNDTVNKDMMYVFTENFVNLCISEDITSSEEVGVFFNLMKEFINSKYTEIKNIVENNINVAKQEKIDQYLNEVILESKKRLIIKDLINMCSKKFPKYELSLIENSIRIFHSTNEKFFNDYHEVKADLAFIETNDGVFKRAAGDKGFVEELIGIPPEYLVKIGKPLSVEDKKDLEKKWRN